MEEGIPLHLPRHGNPPILSPPRNGVNFRKGEIPNAIFLCCTLGKTQNLVQGIFLLTVRTQSEEERRPSPQFLRCMCVCVCLNAAAGGRVRNGGGGRTVGVLYQVLRERSVKFDSTHRLSRIARTIMYDEAKEERGRQSLTGCLSLPISTFRTIQC